MSDNLTAAVRPEGERHVPMVVEDGVILWDATDHGEEPLESFAAAMARAEERLGELRQEQADA